MGLDLNLDTKFSTKYFYLVGLATRLLNLARPTLQTEPIGHSPSKVGPNAGTP
jgi:hypothetical protein